MVLFICIENVVWLLMVCDLKLWLIWCWFKLILVILLIMLLLFGVVFELGLWLFGKFFKLV